MTMPKFEPVGYVDYGDRTEWYKRPEPETDLYTADQLTEAYKAGYASRDAEVSDLSHLAGSYLTKAKVAEKERDQLREQVALLREEVTRCRDWFEAQAKVKSKGSPSSWELMLLRDERDAADEALAATEPKK